MIHFTIVRKHDDKRVKICPCCGSVILYDLTDLDFIKENNNKGFYCPDCGRWLCSKWKEKDVLERILDKIESMHEEE